MSDADADGTDELRDLIARARQDGPAPERLASVRARLEARIGPLDAPPTPPAPAAPAKVALGIVAVAVIAIGVWLGARGGDRAAPGTEVDTRALPDTPGAPSGEPSPAPQIALPVADEPATPESPEPAPIEAAAADDEPAVRVERPARRAAPPAPGAIEEEAVAPAEDPASMLREEIALLDRALRARESGDPARAVAALEEHRTRFPSGRLQPERDRMLGELATTEVDPTP